MNCLINEVSVSRIHARLTKEGEKIVLEDVDSKNGVFVDDFRLQAGQRVAVNTESNIKLGNVQVELVINRR